MKKLSLRINVDIGDVIVSIVDVINSNMDTISIINKIIIIIINNKKDKNNKNKNIYNKLYIYLEI